MKREGRIHSSTVRVGKRVLGYGGKGMTNKPTNQSKNSVRHPIGPSIALVVSAAHKIPSQKFIGKTKSTFKAKDLDITRNYLMQDWRIYKRGLADEDNYDDHDVDVEDGSHGTYGYHDERWTSDYYGRHHDIEEPLPEEEQDVGDEYWEAAVESRGRDRARSEIVLPIESLLTIRKRKIAPTKANDVNEQLPSTDENPAGAEITMFDDGGIDANSVDEFESWWSLGFYDEEEVPDDWFLITEGEEFLAA